MLAFPAVFIPSGVDIDSVIHIPAKELKLVFEVTKRHIGDARHTHRITRSNELYSILPLVFSLPA